jgi:hypothetical protein
MIHLTVQQRRAAQYAANKAAGDHDIRAAEQLQHAASSTPNLQRFFESPRGVLVMLCVGVAVFLLYAPLGAFL